MRRIARYSVMRLNVLLFAAGVCLLQQQAELPEARTAWLLAALGIAVLLPAPPGVLAHARRIFVLAACCAAGYGWAALMAGVRLADALPAEWEGRDIRIEGVIAGLPQPSERSVRFEFDVERVLTTGAVVPGRIVLSWWGSPAQDGRPATLPALSPGERWQLTVRLRRPHGMANPHGFDYEAWLLERNLRATGYVRSRTGASSPRGAGAPAAILGRARARRCCGRGSWPRFPIARTRASSLRSLSAISAPFRPTNGRSTRAPASTT